MACFKLCNASVRIFWLAGLLCFLAPLQVATQEVPSLDDESSDAPADYDLSAMRVFNRAMLLAKEQYVEPSRFHPREMLLGALQEVERRVPEILVIEEGKDKLLVQVGSKTTTIAVDKMNSIWDLNFKLRDFFRFFQTNLPKTTNLQELEYAAINGTLSKLDPHSILLEPRFSKEMNVRTKGEFGGLGVVIGLQDGFLTVISPLEGTPAYKAGIKSKDRVIKIGDESTVNMDLDKAVEKLRGAPGTLVYLTVERPRESTLRKFKIVRDVIKVESVSSQLLSDDIGYVKLKEFQGNSAADVSVMISKLNGKTRNGLKGLVLDLRNNPGGLLEQSIDISDLFLDGGVVVVTQGTQAEKREEKFATPGPGKTKLPVIVLVNSGSASASEIVAGALKNRERALVLGEQTFGKGSVQLLYPFPDNSSLKLTIAQYLTPGDESIQSVGITPDIEVHPAYAKDLKSVSLFAQDFQREEDLSEHLDDSTRVIKHKPSFNVTFLDNPPESEDADRFSTKFKEDFDILLAARILKATKGSAKKEMLSAANTVIDTVKKEESAKIASALKKLGVDWSTPPNDVKGSKIVASIVKSATAKAGDELEIKVEVKNVGDKSLFQVYGVSDSATRFLKGREFLFGKLDPNQKRQFSAKIKLPRDFLTRRDFMRINFFGNGANELTSLDIPIQMLGLPKPVFAYSAFIDDSRFGNGDGFLEPGEKVDLMFEVKNIGKGESKEPMILVKNKGGSEVSIEEGRKKLAALKPGQSAVDKLTFTVKEGAKNAQLLVVLYDADAGVAWKEKLNIPIRPKAPKVEKASGRVEVTAKDTPLYYDAESDKSVIARLPAKLAGDQIVRIGDKVRVRFSPTMSGFVNASALKASSGPRLPKRDLVADFVYDHTPPEIEFADGVDRPLVAKEKYRLNARIIGDTPVKDAYIYLNDQKVFYKEIDGKGATNTKIETDLKLKPGVNVVTVFARKDENYDQRSVITIFSESGDPLQKTADMR